MLNNVGEAETFLSIARRSGRSTMPTSAYATISLLVDPHFQQVNHFQSAPI
jgi:hypothetical protein